MKMYYSNIFLNQGMQQRKENSRGEKWDKHLHGQETTGAEGWSPEAGSGQKFTLSGALKYPPGPQPGSRCETGDMRLPQQSVVLVSPALPSAVIFCTQTSCLFERLVSDIGTLTSDSIIADSLFSPGNTVSFCFANTLYCFSWRRKWQPTPVFLPGKSHGWSSLVGYSPWGRKESDTTERLHFHFHFILLRVYSESIKPACIDSKFLMVLFSGDGEEHSTLAATSPGKKVSSLFVSHKGRQAYIAGNFSNIGRGYRCCFCCCLVAKSCLTLCNPMDYSLPGSSVHGISQQK